MYVACVLSALCMKVVQVSTDPALAAQLKSSQGCAVVVKVNIWFDQSSTHAFPGLFISTQSARVVQSITGATVHHANLPNLVPLLCVYTDVEKHNKVVNAWAEVLMSTYESGLLYWWEVPALYSYTINHQRALVVFLPVTSRRCHAWRCHAFIYPYMEDQACCDFLAGICPKENVSIQASWQYTQYMMMWCSIWWCDYMPITHPHFLVLEHPPGLRAGKPPCEASLSSFSKWFARASRPQ